MNNRKEDMGLTALLEAGGEVEHGVPERVLRDAYAIQVDRQFEKERDAPLNETRKLIESYVDESGEEDTK